MNVVHGVQVLSECEKSLICPYYPERPPAIFFIFDEEKFRKVDMLLVVSKFQSLDLLEQIRKHSQKVAQNLKNGIFKCIQIVGNTSHCKQWTCSHRITHFDNNFNRNTRLFGSWYTCASRFFKFLYQIAYTFYRTQASFQLMI